MTKLFFTLTLLFLTLGTAWGEPKPSEAVKLFWEGVEGGDWPPIIKKLQVMSDRGDSDASNQLGGAYYFDFGHFKDYKAAAKWYRLAVDQGNQYSCLTLGYMYERGDGVTQDYKEAMKLYKLAISRGAVAQGYFRVGDMYANGHGVTQDHEEARKWYQLAADHGYVPAKKALNSMPYVKTDSTERTATTAPESKPKKYSPVVPLKGEGEFAPIPNKLATLNCTLNIIGNIVYEEGITIDYTNMMVGGSEAKFYENEIRWTRNSYNHFLNRLSGFISIVDGKSNDVIATGHCVPAGKRF